MHTLVHKSRKLSPIFTGFCKILALNYAPEAAAPGAWIIWSNILSQICSRSIFECTMLQEHITNMLPEAYLKYKMLQEPVLYAPGAVYIQIMLLEHIELRILPQLIHAQRAAVPGAAAPRPWFRAKISEKRFSQKICASRTFVLATRVATQKTSVGRRRPI